MGEKKKYDIDRISTDTAAQIAYDRWQYRHDMFWKQWTRWAVWIILLNAAPWTGALGQGQEFLGPILAGFAAVLTLVATWLLDREFQYLTSDRELLESILGDAYTPRRVPARKFLEWWKLGIGTTFTLVFVCGLLSLSVWNLWWLLTN